jgi:transcriptional activator of cad operon
MGVAASGVLRIGAWRVEPALDAISRNGKSVKLEPRTMRVLVCLAEHAGEVVSVDQLLDAVWKDVIVTPDSVYQAVAGLRRAFADGTEEPAYIVNVLRRGYRLVAPVAPDASASPGTDRIAAQVTPVLAPSIAAPAAVTPAMTRSRPRWPWVLFIGAAMMAIGYPIAKKFWLQPGATSGEETTALTVDAGQPSVAVLPFVDMSDQKDQAYLADGLSEELIYRLARVRGLRVPARTSSFYFKDKQASVPEIARALGVAHLLEGSVRNSGNTLRITTQLVRVDSGYQVWSKTFDRPLTDVFKIQDEIAGAVAQVLELSLIDHDMPQDPPTENIEAYSHYLRARSNVVSNRVDDYDAAVEHAHSALVLDPQYAAASAQLALVTIWKFDMRSPPTAAACADARAAADQALKLNSRLAMAHRAVGVVFQFCDYNFTAAEAQFNQALELEVGGSDSLRSLTWLAIDAGRLDEALQLAQRAVSRDPLNAWDFAALGDASSRAGHLREAEAAYRKAVTVQPGTAGLHALFANALLSMNKPLEAIAEAQREPDAQWRQLTLSIALDAAGRKSDADREITVYELQFADDYPNEIALFYACRHDAGRAIQWFRRFAEKHVGEFNTLGTEGEDYRTKSPASKILPPIRATRRCRNR